jgi:AcrR family transcriptional regulator
MAVIAERAGVSRGASQHHFRTREELVTAAVEYVTDVRLGTLRQHAEKTPRGKQRTEAVLESLTDFYTSPFFMAALHVWVAASTDAKLRALVVGLEAQVGREVHRTTVELLGVDEREPGVREAVQATCDLARGLGLANLLADDSARRKRVLRQWARMLDDELKAGRR